VNSVTSGTHIIGSALITMKGPELRRAVELDAALKLLKSRVASARKDGRDTSAMRSLEALVSETHAELQRLIQNDFEFSESNC
jgi:hypothetical protein